MEMQIGFLSPTSPVTQKQVSNMRNSQSDQLHDRYIRNQKDRIIETQKNYGYISSHNYLIIE